MRLLIDGTMFQKDYGLGIQRYFREMLGRVGAYHQVSIWNEYPARVPLPQQCKQIGPPRWWQVASRAKRRGLRKMRTRARPAFDVFCSTYYTRSPYANLTEVVVVHDMIYEQFLWLMADAEGVVATKRDAILNARICICVSRATADELKSFYPEVAERVRVAYPGCDHLIAAMESPVNDADFPFGDPPILFVGSRGTYKNFQTLLMAMTTVEWPTEVKLAVVGTALSVGEMLTIRRLGLTERVIHLGELSDTQLAHAYRRSLGFVFPSLQEGFGFPSLEAQCCGTPVLCSDIPTFREVAAEAAIYFDPRIAESIAAAVRKLLDPGVSRQLRELGKQNVRRFTWDGCAYQTLAAFREATS